MDKKIKVLFAAIAIALVVSIASMSYAYFTIASNEEGSVTNITSATMGIEYDDGDEIIVNYLMPGDYVDKSFSIRNIGSYPLKYDILLDEVYNNFEDQSDLVYELISNDGGFNTSSQIQAPSVTTKIVDGQSLSMSTTHTYTLRITFLNKDENQDENQGKSFRAKIKVNTYQAISSNGGGGNPMPPTIITGDLETIGSEVALGSEHFYVIGKQDANHVKLLAKYNLDESNLQSEYTYVQVSFSSSSSFFNNASSSGSSVTYYNEALDLGTPPDDPNEPYTPTYYSTHIYDVYNESASISAIVNNYVSYLNTLGYSATGRLLSIGQDVALSGELHGYCEGGDGCGSLYSDPSNIDPNLVGAITYPNDYWTGSAFEGSDSIVLISSRDGGDYTGYGYYNAMAVRPVIILEI